MMQLSKRFYVFLPWAITLAILAASTFYGVYKKDSTNPFKQQSYKADLVSSMQIHLLEAIEAEKNAVMAITDEDSEAFAAKARQASDTVEKNRKEIEAIFQKDENPQERKLSNEFNVCWMQYRKLDETILALAVQNTNLKAQKISSTQCVQEMAVLEESLNNVIRENRNNQNADVINAAYEMLTDSLKIFALHKPHIEAADDPQMDKIEKDIKSYDEAARKALNTMSGIAQLRHNPDLKTAQAAYDKFMDFTGEVLRLSRLNTNIKSAGLSLGKKRLISAQCQEILTELHKAVQVQGNYSLPRLKKGF